MEFLFPGKRPRRKAKASAFANSRRRREFLTVESLENRTLLSAVTAADLTTGLSGLDQALDQALAAAKLLNENISIFGGALGTAYDAANQLDPLFSSVNNVISSNGSSGTALLDFVQNDLASQTNGLLTPSSATLSADLSMLEFTVTITPTMLSVPVPLASTLSLGPFSLSTGPASLTLNNNVSIATQLLITAGGTANSSPPQPTSRTSRRSRAQGSKSQETSPACSATMERSAPRSHQQSACLSTREAISTSPRR